MRTVFMVEGSIDSARIDRELAVLEQELGARLETDGIPATNVVVTAGLDCRYVGQGYELRVPLPSGRFSETALAEFHRLHDLEYGHAFQDPIEIVNLRVSAVGSRAKVGRLPLPSGSLEEALVGEGSGVFRENGSLGSLSTRYYERWRLPQDVTLSGPAVIFQRDTTVLVPPRWAARAEASGNLVLAHAAP
jgi:N-methylhydantoinase A